MDDLVKTIFIDTKNQRSTGFLGKEKESKEIDGCNLAKAVETTCNSLLSSGYKIISITPITSGNNDFQNGIGYGYGYSYTSGLLITANKI